MCLATETERCATSINGRRGLRDTDSSRQWHVKTGCAQTTFRMVSWPSLEDRRNGNQKPSNCFVARDVFMLAESTGYAGYGYAGTLVWKAVMELAGCGTRGGRGS
jgi:hypothetical protein